MLGRWRVRPVRSRSFPSPRGRAHICKLQRYSISLLLTAPISHATFLSLFFPLSICPWPGPQRDEITDGPTKKGRCEQTGWGVIHQRRVPVIGSDLGFRQAQGRMTGRFSTWRRVPPFAVAVLSTLHPPHFTTPPSRYPYRTCYRSVARVASHPRATPMNGMGGHGGGGWNGFERGIPFGLGWIAQPHQSAGPVASAELRIRGAGIRQILSSFWSIMCARKPMSARAKNVPLILHGRRCSFVAALLMAPQPV
ncbi:hypothetical protein QBC47DRAFT_207103 [Echria macrotheca]|uniref:Uncharacterized protein n=1 Tax=Echria macrotheca TaxID=438768 RepID=A0AAJ0BDE1_9PEZI|nr:hypothetical protein QBC47DRAFT_207103 [Echria macrotheca]